MTIKIPKKRWPPKTAERKVKRLALFPKRLPLGGDEYFVWFSFYMSHEFYKGGTWYIISEYPILKK